MKPRKTCSSGASHALVEVYGAADGWPQCQICGQSCIFKIDDKEGPIQYICEDCYLSYDFNLSIEELRQAVIKRRVLGV